MVLLFVLFRVAATVLESLSPLNEYRYLLAYDDASFAYVQHEDVRVKSVVKMRKVVQFSFSFFAAQATLWAK